MVAVQTHDLLYPLQSVVSIGNACAMHLISHVPRCPYCDVLGDLVRPNLLTHGSLALWVRGQFFVYARSVGGIAVLSSADLIIVHIRIL